MTIREVNRDVFENTKKNKKDLVKDEVYWVSCFSSVGTGKSRCKQNKGFLGFQL